ncbi:hypothetical protein BH24CHL7_BH24CHL7_14800 [soil metagenome]
MVHGGARFVEPTLIDEDVFLELQEVAALAPLHNCVAIDGIRTSLQLLPDVPHVAVFDTACHSSLPEAAFVYPLPWQWYEEWGSGATASTSCRCSGRCGAQASCSVETLPAFSWSSRTSAAAAP